jgi:hypothetical protein
MWAKRIAMLYSAAEPPTERELREAEAAARTLGVTLLLTEASNLDALNQAFANAVANGGEALLPSRMCSRSFTAGELPSADLNAEISYCAFNLGVAKQKLDSPRLPVRL